jgi:glyoxylase-like metal-dependent hydrolase (beta-lactamase superfamily II)
MKQLYPDLWQTHLERPIRSAPRAASHAYLLTRQAGNLLFYNTGREAIGPVEIEADLGRIQELGGITHQFLAHWHEAAPSLAEIRKRFGSALAVHGKDAEAVARESGTKPDLVLGGRQTLLGDIEVIPTPGHTAGSVCYLYSSPHGRTYLFTGDTLFPRGNRWGAMAFEDEPGQPNLRGSLELLRGLKPDVALAAAAAGDETYRELSNGEWTAAVDSAVASLS